jgi:uncharacterized FAD-dependent dehydrogenase
MCTDMYICTHACVYIFGIIKLKNGEKKYIRVYTTCVCIYIFEKKKETHRKSCKKKRNEKKKQTRHTRNLDPTPGTHPTRLHQPRRFPRTLRPLLLPSPLGRHSSLPSLACAPCSLTAGVAGCAPLGMAATSHPPTMVAHCWLWRVGRDSHGRTLPSRVRGSGRLRP